MATKLFLSTTCGSVVVKVQDSGTTIICCGNEMMERYPDMDDVRFEKHVLQSSRSRELPDRGYCPCQTSKV